MYIYIRASSHTQDTTQGLFLCSVRKFEFQSFPSPRSVAKQKLKKPVCPTIYSFLEREYLYLYLSQGVTMWDANEETSIKKIREIELKDL